MHSLAQAALGELPKGPRKGGLGRDIGRAHKTADAPEDRRSPQGFESGPGGGVVIHRLAHKGPGHGSALQQFPAESLGGPTGKFLDLDQFQDLD